MGVISGVIGKWVGLTDDVLQELVLTGLMHDVGKTQIPDSILNKPGKLSDAEMEIMKIHAAHGYRLLKKTCQVPEAVMLGVLHHHERIDGSRYPQKLTGDQLSLNAKIMAVADVHDAMTSNRVYHRGVSPFSVIAEFSSAMFDKLAPEICSVFLNNFKDSLVGSIVRLSDFSAGKVIFIDRQRLDRPIIQTLDGQNYINLMERPDLHIVGVVAI